VIGSRARIPRHRRSNAKPKRIGVERNEQAAEANP
jgi:hypothetical protein